MGSEGREPHHVGRLIAATRLGAALAASVALALSAAIPASATPGAGTSPSAYQDGVLLVGFDKSASQQQRTAAVASVAATDNRTIGIGVHVLHVPPGQVLSAARRLGRQPGIRFAEPDYIEYESGAPNDPSFGQQWAYQNTGQLVNTVGGTPGADERAVQAWDITHGSRSIVIGEVDSGLDYTHPDLAANVWSNPGGVGGCAAGTHGYNAISSTCDPMDDDTVYGGHGTHVAGILGAVGDNGIGVTGVNWTTTILPVKWVGSGGSGTTSNLIIALDWLVQAKQAGVNLRVVNDSQTWAGTAPSQALSDEIDLLGQNGILFVTAAGNTGDNNDNPALRRYPCANERPTEICVTASNQEDALPSWANIGSTTVDLAAPGDNVYSTLRNASYGIVSGGSMASPQVAGAAALILSVQDMSPQALKADILENVDPLPSLSGLVRTGGRLDICKALPGCTPPVSGVFGQSSIGSNSDRMSADRKRVNHFQLTVAGSLSKLTTYLAPTDMAGQQVIEGVIYSDQSGSPGARLAVSNELTFHSADAAGWYDLVFSSPVSLQPGVYWIGVISGSTSLVAGFRWSSVSDARAYNPNPYGSGPSDPFGAPTVDSEQMSLYATYAASSSSPPSLFNVTPPSIGGITQQGQNLTAAAGDWTGVLTSYAYQWRRCSSIGSSCTNVVGATSASYQTGSADVGSTMQVAVTATDGTNTVIGYSPPSSVVQITSVSKQNQTVTFTSTAPTGATVGGPTYTPTATASSGLSVVLTINTSAASVCSMSGGAVSFIGAGTCVIDANQPGNATYDPALQLQQSLPVGTGSQIITFTSTAPTGATAGGSTYSVTATTTSGLAVTFTIDATAGSVCSISGSKVSFIGAGTCVIDANQSGNANYNPANQVQHSFAVGKGSQTVTFTSTAPTGATVGGPTYTPTATASSGLSVVLTINTSAASVCSMSGGAVSLIGAGTCAIDANQPGNANYNAASQVQQSFSVTAPAPPDFSMSASPASRSVRHGNQTTYTVTISPVNGFNEIVTLSAGSLPSGVTVSFSPASVSGAGSSTLTIRVAKSAAPVSNVTLTLTGTSASRTHTTKVLLTIR